MAVFIRHSPLFHKKCVMIQANGAEQLKGGLVMYRILVVDDEAKIACSSANTREFEGHEVTEAENGMEAVRLFRKTPDAFRYCHHGCDDAGA